MTASGHKQTLWEVPGMSACDPLQTREEVPTLSAWLTTPIGLSDISGHWSELALIASVVNDPIQKSSSSREREIGRSNRRDGLRPCVPPAMVLFVSRCFAMDLRLHHTPRRHVHRLEHDCDVDMEAIRKNFSR